MSEEMIDIVDEAMTPLGIASKKLAHRTGLWHYSIHCWVYRQDSDTGETFLIFQKRGPNKDLYPDYLDISAAGHYQAGEAPEDGVREIWEELGLSVSAHDLINLGLRTEVVKTASVLNREFCRVYLLATKLVPSRMSPGKDEVEGLVEIATSDGLALCAGEVDKVRASGIELRAGEWETYEADVGIDRFIPRADPYYYKMFLLAQLAGRGERFLAV